MTGIAVEPTPSIQVANALQRTGLDRLRASISLLPVPASAVDLESRRIVALNLQFAESLRRPLESILDRTPEELGFQPNSDDRNAVLVGTLDGGIHHTHRRTKLPDGTWVEYTDSSRRILVDGRECLLSCYEPASRMVSEATSIRKAKELELEQSEERLRLVLDATSDGVFDWDIPSGKVYFSPAYFTMLGYEPFEFPSTFDAWRERVHPDDLLFVEPAIQAHLSNQDRTPYLVEFRMRHKQGRWSWIQAKGKVVRSDADGKPVRMVGTHSDITDR
ncbi:MAG: PAS domain-containing protein, partial [Fibrobacterota bacterium]